MDIKKKKKNTLDCINRYEVEVRNIYCTVRFNILERRSQKQEVPHLWLVFLESKAKYWGIFEPVFTVSLTKRITHWSRSQKQRCETITKLYLVSEDNIHMYV